MTRFTITNGEARALLTSLLPHAGKESEDSPELGRIRFAREPERLHAWTSDYVTHGAAAAVVVDQDDGELDTWDMTTETVRAVLAVFRGPSNPDQRQMWEDSELRVTVLDEVVVFDEDGGLLEGRSLTVPRVLPVGPDKFPDVPRFLVDMLADPPTDVAGAITLAKRIAPFLPSAKAWGERLTITLTQGDYPHLIVMAGGGFIGAVSTSPLTDEVREQQRTAHHTWQNALVPLRRPVPQEVPADVVEALTEQAKALHRDGVTLTVTTTGDPDA